MRNITHLVTAVGLVLACISGARADVVLDTVAVGNPGNPIDTHGYGHGSVDYEYNIGKYEVTAGQYTEFLNAVAGVDTYGLYNTSMWSNSYNCKIERFAGSGTVGDPYQYRVAADRANRPVNMVCWGDAARFANWLHNGKPTGVQDLSTTEDGSYLLAGATTDADLQAVSREPDATWVVPTEDEWYKAAYHKNDGVTGNYWDYPTGTDSAPSNDLVNPDPGNNACFEHGDYTIGSPYWRTEVGEFENSMSPYGTFDQGGNVFEWIEDMLYVPPRGVRGGSYYNDVSYLHVDHRFPYAPTQEASIIGFRLAKVPEPSTLSLLVLGGLGALRRKRTRAVFLRGIGTDPR